MIKHGFTFHKHFISFEIAPNNFEFVFERISFNQFEYPDRKFFLDDRDPDFNYFNEINIPSKETTYVNDTNVRGFLYEAQRFENVFVLHVDI